MKNEQLAGHLAVAGAYTIFGLNIVFNKDIANVGIVSPMMMFFLRAAGATALFWLLSLFMPKEPVAKKDFVPIALASVTGLFITQVSFLLAIPMSTSIDTSIVATLSPVFTMFFAFIFLGEPITWKKVLGVAVSLFGILLLIFNSTHNAGAVAKTAPLGFVLLFLNSISFATYLGAFRVVISRYSVVTFMKWSFLFSLILCIPFAYEDIITTDYAALPAKTVWEILYVVVMATFVAYFLIPYGQKRIRPTLVSMYTYLQPIIAVIISIASGLDVISWQKGLAILLVFSGVFLVIRSRAAVQPASESIRK